ncbi:YfhJ family protein [Bacillus sp. 179-C3.3 HS]|uniref:YfhJ family protein n=1 Tax=Bacillus sp. 179-C3.3 HS TaxID=3232162 RepID=UPI0039A0B148
MEQYFERLTEQLMNKNNMLTYEEARTWVELLWSDFETTYAKAGRKYKGQETTERIVYEWIESYGAQLHLFQNKRSKAHEHLQQQNKGLLH